MDGFWERMRGEEEYPTFLKITCPLVPFRSRDGDPPPPSSRLRREDSLNLKKMVKQLESSVLYTTPQKEKEGDLEENWSILHVFSPYSPSLHVMVMNLATDLILPGPESCTPEQGNTALRLSYKVLTFLESTYPEETHFMGYNWSPKAWGEPDQLGYQSLATKWHIHLFSWPDPSSESFKKIGKSDLSLFHQQFFSQDLVIQELSLVLQSQLQTWAKDPSHPPWLSSLTFSPSINGLTTYFPTSLSQTINLPNFFSLFLHPLSIILDNFFSALTEAVCDISPQELTTIVQAASHTPPSQEALKILQRSPKMKSREEITQNFQKNGWPSSLLSPLCELVEERCSEAPRGVGSWKKCFAYGVVFASCSPSSSPSGGCLVKIVVGARSGPAGIIEGSGVVLCRPQHHDPNEKTELLKGLWDLQDYLEDKKEL